MNKYLITTLCGFVLLNNCSGLGKTVTYKEVKQQSPIVVRSVAIGGREIIKKPKTYRVKLTGYDNCYACTQSGKGITANGKTASRGTVAAVQSIPFNTKVHIVNAPKNVHPERTVEDRGGAIRIVNGVYRFDIWFPTHKEAEDFGVKYGTMYYKNNEIYINVED